MAPAVRKRKNYTMRIASVLLCLVLITTWLVSDMFARYATTAESENSADVAAFVFEIEDVKDSENTETCLTIPVTGIVKPGDSSTYSFIVKNNTAGIVAEVEQEYKISMKVNGSMPLICILSQKAETEGAADVPVLELKQLYEDGQAAAQKSADAAAQYFSAAVSEQDAYILTATWPETVKDAKYANGSGLAEVQLIIQTVQKD